MAPRTLKMTVPTHRVQEGGGFWVRRPAAMGSLMSPFLLLDEMGPSMNKPGEAVGAPWHPHRGFETVTYLLEGAMQHEDSEGNKGDLFPGDVQWMTAGRGIIHSEEPHPDFQKTGGTLHGFQIWVNLPSEHKMMNPRYQDIPSSQIPIVEAEGIWARVIAGECLGINAIIDTVIPITYIHLKIEEGYTHQQSLASDLNAMIYVFGGEVSIEGKVIRDGQLGILNNGEDVNILATKNAQMLILAGPELNEPIARYGPFVMNTREEIMQAVSDYRNGILTQPVQ